MKHLLFFLAISLSAQSAGYGPSPIPTQGSLGVSNDGTTGTKPNRLAVLVSGNAAVATTASTTGILGIVVSGAGKAGRAEVAQLGTWACDFDGPTTAGDYVVASTVSAGACHDTGSSAYPAGVSVVGMVAQSGGNLVYVLPGAPVGGSGGGGGGATTPSTSLPLCGNGAPNSTKACTAGTDFVAPNANVSTLTNDSGYQTATQVTAAISGISATNIVSKFTGCSGALLLGADGACHPGASLPSTTGLLQGDGVGGAHAATTAAQTITINNQPCVLTGTCAITATASPGGSNSQVQINSNGALAGVSQLLYVNGASPNGISGAISACGTSISCSIIVPPSYAGTEVLPGFSNDPNNFNATGNYSTMAGTVFIDDRRTLRWYATNNLGYCQGSTCGTLSWQFNHYLPLAGGAIQSALNLTQNSWGNGVNNQVNGFTTNKTTYNTASFNLNSTTSGQHIGLTSNLQCFGLGDCLAVNTMVRVAGGYNATADEGGQTGDNRVFQDNVVPSGTVGGSPATGSTSLTLTFSTGVGHQGDGRFLIKTNAGVLSAGTISAISSSAGNPTTLTGVSTGWPVSTVVALLGTSVNGGASATVTPNTYSAGSISGITTSSLVCIGGYGSFEMVYPSAVSGSTFTAVFVKPHAYFDSIAVGGVCGLLMDLTADEATAAVFPNTNNEGPLGTLRLGWPMMYSTSATSAVMWVSGAGGYRQLVTRWNSATANGYKLYPFAEVTSVLQNGGPSNVFTLSPNNVAWANGDTWEQLLYPAVHISPGFNIYQSYFPCFIDAACGAGVTFNGPMHDNDQLWSATNGNRALQYYSALSGATNQGKYYPPYGLVVTGPVRSGLQITTPGPDGAIVIGCPYYDSGCTANYGVLRASNSSLFDSILYDPVNKRFGAQRNNGTAVCWLDGSCGGGTATLPATPGTAGKYTLVATDTGTPTTTYVATLATQIPACSTLVAATQSGTCTGTTGLIQTVEYTRNVTGGYTIVVNDLDGVVSNSTSGATYALPQPGTSGNFTSGQWIYLLNVSSGGQTIQSSGGATVNGSSSATLAPNGQCKARSDGSNWTCH